MSTLYRIIDKLQHISIGVWGLGFGVYNLSVG